MKKSGGNIKPEEILKQVSAFKLHEFIVGYAAKHPEFMAEFSEKFNPEKASESKEDYAAAIRKAFTGNALKSCLPMAVSV